MSTTTLTAGQVMNRAASLMNDTARTVYTYTAQIPYLNMAIDDLQEQMELNNIPITNEESAAITIPIGTTQINPAAGYAPTTAPNYPVNLVEVQRLWERLSGSNDSYIAMTRREFLPHFLEGSPSYSLVYWTWEDQRIKFISGGATTARQVKLDYVKAVLPDGIVDDTTEIGIINARSYLAYHTAALMSRYVGENETRADSLDAKAEHSLYVSLGISVKGRQSIPRRRRPFMASYKIRSYG